MPTDEGVDRSRAWSRSISPTSEIQPFTSSLPYGTAPRIQKCMLDYVEVEAGEKLQLTCLVEGNPIPIGESCARLSYRTPIGEIGANIMI